MLWGWFPQGNNMQYREYLWLSTNVKERVTFSSLLLSTRLQAPVVPDFSLFGQIIGDAFALAFVGYGIAISLGRIFALKYGYSVDSNQVGRWRRGWNMSNLFMDLYMLLFLFSVRNSLPWVWVTQLEGFSSASPSAAPCLAPWCRRAQEGGHRWDFFCWGAFEHIHYLLSKGLLLFGQDDPVLRLASNLNQGNIKTHSMILLQ